MLGVLGMKEYREYYEEHGYCVYQQLIPADDIDQLVAEFKERIFTSRRLFFRQNSGRWEKNIVSSDGYIQNSLLNIHDYPDFESFSTNAKKILCGPQVRKAMQEITGEDSLKLMQSMFFDQNTATPAHQDYYYLDSMPNGHLFAGWFALEDINEEAGRFFVLPGSHKTTFTLTAEEAISNRLYVKKIETYVDAHKANVVAPALKKGDVLFWHSKTIHGSLPTKNPKYSRKSLTAHYMPSQFQFGNMFGNIAEGNYDNFEGMSYSRTENRFSWGGHAKNEIRSFLVRHPRMQRIASTLKSLTR
jgi:phytanoyl-CoA hydroxylase